MSPSLGTLRVHGHETALSELAAGPTTEAVRRGIDQWTAAVDFDEEDMVVLR
ncbi:hypothetical protein OG361_04240 [Streptomyces sp. NBC_00090]|uniref:hypothetical protein n=1 Tax=Streptomyces sp. NBC_00090 TaxID=2903619 RepID=UPI0032507C71